MKSFLLITLILIFSCPAFCFWGPGCEDNSGPEDRLPERPKKRSVCLQPRVGDTVKLTSGAVGSVVKVTADTVTVQLGQFTLEISANANLDIQPAKCSQVLDDNPHPNGFMFDGPDGTDMYGFKINGPG